MMIDYCAAVLLLDICANVLPNTTMPALASPEPAIIHSSEQDRTEDFLIRAGADEIVVSLLDRRLFYRDTNGAQKSFPVSIGAQDTPTPTGTFRIIKKKANPEWRPPPTARKRNPDLPAVVAPGPDNPLGTHALYLDRPMYLIHGTEEPGEIGQANSLGCVRLDNQNIARLYPAIAKGARVKIAATPVWIQETDGSTLLRIATFATEAALTGETVAFGGRQMPVTEMLDTLGLSLAEAKDFTISLTRITLEL